MVAGGHKTKTPSSLTYLSVVSRDILRIALTISALNYLKFLVCDIHNVYLTKNCREKTWTVEGPYFCTEQVKFMLVLRAMYVLKSYGVACRDLLAEQSHDFGYRPSIADPDVCMRPSFKPVGFVYYEYLL